MPRNGSGGYSIPSSAFIAGTTIDPSPMNANFSDIASALTDSVAADGQTPMTGNLNMASHAIQNATVIQATGSIITSSTVVANAGLVSTGFDSGGANVRYVGGNYGVMEHNDGTNHYILITNSGTPYGSFNSLRPLTINLASGSMTAGNGFGVTGNLTVSGSATVGGSAVVKADGGTYSISIGGNAATATTASSANAVAWSNVSSKPGVVTSMDQNVASSSAVTFANVAVTTGVAGIAGGYQYTPTGQAVFPGGSGVNVGFNASGLDVLGNRFIAASDGRLKEDKRPISLEEGLAFVTNVPAMLYQKHGVGGRDYEAGFVAQDMINAGLVQTIVVAQDPDMPAERFGSVGPAGTRYEMQTGAAVAYLSVVVRHLLTEVERLKA